MISELNLIWKLEDNISELIDKASKEEEEKERQKYGQKIDFYREVIEEIRKQPLWDKWIPITLDTPTVDGRYQVFQEYEEDGYLEVSTAIWKNNSWDIETGEYNHKYGSYSLKRNILMWAPLQSPPPDEAIRQVKEELMN